MNSMNKTFTPNSLPRSSNGFGTMPNASTTISATPPIAPGAASTFVVCSRMANARVSNPWSTASHYRRNSCDIADPEQALQQFVNQSPWDEQKCSIAIEP